MGLAKLGVQTVHTNTFRMRNYAESSEKKKMHSGLDFTQVMLGGYTRDARMRACLGMGSRVVLVPRLHVARLSASPVSHSAAVPHGSFDLQGSPKLSKDGYNVTN